MLMVVACNHCHKSGTFDIEIKFHPHGRSCCGHCGQEEQKFWLFNFCDIECLFGWLRKKKVSENGIPCRDCIDYGTGKASGFTAGFKQNGICGTCKGKKAVKGSVKKILASIR